MAAASSPRRSARARKSNNLHNDTISWADAAALLRAHSNSPDRSSESSAPESIQRIDDDDFDTKAVEVEVEEKEDEDEEPDANIAEESSDDAEPPPTGTPSNYAAMFKAGVKRYSSSKAASKPIVFPRPKEKEWTKTQGLKNRLLHQDKERLRGPVKTAMTDNFGPELEDLYPVIRARDIWNMTTRDLVLPSRISISEALKLEAQGKYLPFKKTERQFESDQHQVQRLNHFRESRPISFDEARAKLYYHAHCRSEAVLGPWDKGCKVKLHVAAPVDISTTYSNSSQTPSIPEKNSPHRGWLVNLGARVQCLAWARTAADVQYIAVAFKSTARQRQTAAVIDKDASPAFSPTSPYPSHVQILKVEAAPGNAVHPAHLSHEPNTGPYLHQMLCTNWGSIMHLEWQSSPVTDDLSHINRALVLLSSDGNIRIVSVDLQTTGYEEMLRPDKIARPPPDTVFTCFCLPSHSDLVTGDTTGAVHLFNVNQASADGQLFPYATYHIHNTYVMAVTVASDHPYALCSQSAAGEMILTDLRSPRQDRVAIHKARLPTRNLIYYPFTRMFMTTTDSAGNSESTGSSLGLLVGHNMRHFYQTQWLLKIPECSGVITSLATSPFHPIVLVANASGMVFASNVLKRLLPVGWKSEDNKVQSWVVKLCELDWVEFPDAATFKDPRIDKRSADGDIPGEKAQIDVFHGRDARPGIMRLHEGFQPSRVEVSSAVRSASGRTPKSVIAEREATSQIILPEEQAVTAMAWNPNSRFSGWAAIAWGNGVLCIKDLSHDAKE